MGSKKDFLSITDFTAEELEDAIELAGKVKAKPKKYSDSLENKTLASIFEKPSTRTRVSFEVAIMGLGGNSIVLSPSDMQLGRGETIADSARVLSRYVDCIMARVYSHRTLEELASYSTVPVVNGLSDMEHPCQVTGDLLTIDESAGELSGVKLTYIGDGNNVCNSLILGCAMTGVDLNISTPKGYEPRGAFLDKAGEYTKDSGANITLHASPFDAVKDADFVYTDVWVSMGDEKEEEARENAFRNYQVNTQLLEKAKPDCRILHCLPAHRGVEITDKVIDSSNSRVWDQAENRLHAQKAILLKLIGE